ncbi:MAG TPA: ABC transporter substrate-binding protein [Methylomirabilota bacterium]|nr:ABC transporter substrate-binding protein [Methylomirabilota bacterium]
MRALRRVGLVLLLLAAAGAAVAATPADVLIVAVSGDLVSIDPPFSSGAPFQNEVITNLYDYLVEFGTKGDGKGGMMGDLNSFAGKLAQSWTVSPDGTKVTFKLRPGAKFASGDPVTVQDVKHTYDRIFGVKAVTAALTKMAAVEGPESIRIVDPQTLEFTLAKGNPLLFGNMAQYGHGVTQEKALKPHGAPDDPWATKWLRSNDAGGGPFALERWTPGAEIVLRRNEHYWAGPAKLKQVVFKIVPEAATRTLLLRNGSVDVATDLPFQDVLALQGDPNVQVLSFPSTIVKYVAMNVKTPPFDQVKVRQAVAHAVPYETIMKEVVKGFGRQLKGLAPEGMLTADPSLWRYATDTGKAKQLLSEAGLASGFKTTLTVRTGFPADEQIAVWIQSALRPLGAEVAIEKLPLAGFTDRMRKKEMAFFVHEWLSINNDPFYHYFWLAQPGCCNYANYDNPQVTGLIKEFMLTTDQKARAEASRRVQQLFMEDAPWVFLYQPDVIVTMRKNVRGYIYWPDRYTRYHSISKP